MSDAPTPGSGGAGIGADLAVGRSLERALSQVVRTPLHSLLGFLELLSMSDLDDDQRRLHEQLVTSAEDLLSGSDRILWLVRLLGGHYAPRPARVHLAAFVAEVAAASDGTVSGVVAPDAPLHVDVDLAALHQLVTELISNATAHGGAPVILAVAPDGIRGEGVRITVSDGGAGRPSAARTALAEAVAGSGTGGGLGLVLVRHLSALLGGTVRVVPTHVGTHVALTVPVVHEGGLEAGREPEPAHPADPGSGRPLRVLLVEDNATNRLLTHRQLARLGHSLTAVATGEEGVRAAQAEDIDVVLMDRHLPDLDGCEVAMRILADRPADRRHLPIIAVTADATTEARDACAAAGMAEVLTKPVDLQHLGEALARAARAIDGNPDLQDGRPGARGAALPPALRFILARVEGDPEAAAELTDTYLGELPGRRLRIQASLRRGQSRAVLAAAESLRTSSESLGVTAVSGACAALGAAAAADDLAAARSFLPSLMRQCEQVSAELAGFSDAGSIRAALAAASY